MNTNRVAKFEKVSYEQFVKDCQDINNDINTHDVYDSLKLPKRATKYSAGYDFFLPYDVTFEPNVTVLIPTGIRVRIECNWVLKIFPRSSLGFKYMLKLNNTVGIIDSDYYYSQNEGHIFIKLTNHSNQTLKLSKGSAVVQGIFSEYGITFDDDTNEVRDGGFGSTDQRRLDS